MQKEINWDKVKKAFQERLQKDRGKSEDSESYEETWKELRSLCKKRINNLARNESKITSDDKDDIVQDIMLHLQNHKTIELVLRAGSIDGYVSTIIFNQFRDLRRIAYRKHNLETGYSWEMPSESEIDIRKYSIIELTRQAMLRNALEHLSEEEKALIYERFWEGYTFKEMADSRNEKYSTIAVRLFRILEKLRSLVG